MPKHNTQSTNFTCGPVCIQNVIRFTQPGMAVPDEHTVAAAMNTTEDGSYNSAVEMYFQNANIPFYHLMSVDEVFTVSNTGAVLLNVNNDGVWHFIVTYETYNGCVIVYDPLEKLPYKLTKAQLKEKWLNVSDPIDYLGNNNFRWAIGIMKAPKLEAFSKWR